MKRRVLLSVLVCVLTLSSSWVNTYADNQQNLVQQTDDVMASDKENALFDGGDGSIDNPYLISSQAQLQMIENDMGACYKLTSDIDCTEEWDTIGERYVPFEGILDGDDHTINNFKMNITNGKRTEYTSFIAENHGIIKNIHFKDVDVNVTKPDGVQMGLITTENNYLITGCTVTGSFCANSEDATYDVVGMISAYNNGTISNCATDVKITCTLNSAYFCSVGGISGGGGGMIEFCHNEGDITVTSNSEVQLGGIAAQGKGRFLYNTGNLNITKRDDAIYDYVGGIFAVSGTSVLENVYNTGNLVSNAYAGGIVVELEEGTVRNAFNVGSVSGNSIGGILGRGGSTGSIEENVFENVYYVDNVDWGTSSSKYNKYMTKLSTDQMKNEASFSGFDFDNVWEMGESTPQFRDNAYQYYLDNYGVDDPRLRCDRMYVYFSLNKKEFVEGESLDLANDASIDIWANNYIFVIEGDIATIERIAKSAGLTNDDLTYFKCGTISYTLPELGEKRYIYPIAGKDIVVNGFDTSSVGKKKVSISFAGFPSSDTIEITVKHKEATKKENEVAVTCAKAGSYDLVTYCTECGEEINRIKTTVDKLAHKAGNAVKENEVASTCAKEGSYDLVIYCSECGEEISRIKTSVDKLAHKTGNAVKENEVAATYAKAGFYEINEYCTVCHEKISSITTETPLLKVPNVKVSSLKSNTKNKLTIKWKKQNNIAGYQIRYSLKSNMNSAKIINVSSKATSSTIKKLKSKKKYYVQIRAYVKEDGKKYYSDWSKKKSVKVK